MPKVKVGVNSEVMVRLARLPGMPEQDPSPDEIVRMKQGLVDPSRMREVLREARQEQKNPELNVDMLTAQLHMYPRVRPATVAFVSSTEGTMHTVNLDVFTPGSTVLQGAVNRIPKFAQQHFRLTDVQFFEEEPEDAQEQHVAFWPPEDEEEQRPKRKSR